MGLAGIDKKSLQEILSMASPPVVVGNVVLASCLLLGHPVHIAKDYRTQRNILKAVMRDGATVPDTIDPKALLLAKEEVKRVESVERAKQVSVAASVLYNWATKRLQEMESK